MSRILHVGVGNLDSGGVATYVRAVSEGQRARGHETVLAELWSNGASMPEVEHHLGGLEALRALQDKIRPDATHLHSQLPDYAGLRMPAVLTAHEHTAHCPSGGRYLQARRRVCERRFGLLPCLWGHYVDRCGTRNPSTFRDRFSVTAKSDLFRGEWIAPSSFTATWLERRGLDPHRIHTIGNPLPTAIRTETNPTPEPTILFLGRLVPNKGCDVLVQALALLPSSIHLWIAGEGSERVPLEQLCRRLGLGSRVAFLGWSSPEQVRERLDRSRVLAVPSLWPEPFGLVALEAYAAGRPVVASSVGGLTDLVLDGRTGALVPPNDPARLAQALLQFLSDLPTALRAGAEGAAFAADRHAMPIHLDALDRVYALARERSP